ncbi:MAG: hypothetical protein P4L67_01935 [Candidatus Pacebacteria bacterium]|nr:hypothetical protein [Candidatus Paceibacterota bacterium]
MVTDLLSLQLAFRALSDDPEGDEEDPNAGHGDETLEDDDADGVEDDEDLAAAGFGVEEAGDEGNE